MFRRSFTAVNMMAAETHLQCSTFVSGQQLATTSPTSNNTCEANFAQRIMDHSNQMGFAARAVKKTSRSCSLPRGTQRQQQSSSFIATHDGQRLGVSTGSQSVKSMRKYLRSNNQEDIHGGCDWTVLSCTPTSASFSGKQTVDPKNLQFCIAATQKGSTCSTTVCRGSDGSIAYHSQPSIPNVETNFFYARPDDYVMLHSTQRGAAGSSAAAGCDAAQAVFQAAVRKASNNRNKSSQRTEVNFTEADNTTSAQVDDVSESNQVLDVESLAETVLDALHQHGEEATVVVARLGRITNSALQPPSTA